MNEFESKFKQAIEKKIAAALKPSAAEIKLEAEKEKHAGLGMSKKMVLATMLSFAILFCAITGIALAPGPNDGGIIDKSMCVSGAMNEGDSEDQSAVSEEPHYISNMLAVFSEQYKSIDFYDINDNIDNENIKFIHLVNPKKIASLNIITDSVNEPSEHKGNLYASADVSALNDNSVMAYVYEDTESDTNDSLYYVYICADGVIYANPDSSYMFYNVGSDKITELDLTGLDTSYVKDMSYMFYGCGYNALIALDIGDKFDTSNVTDMSYMFCDCGNTSMTNLNLGDNFYISNVTDMMNMFNKCGNNSMTNLDMGAFGDILNVEYYDGIFDSCGKEGCVVTVKSQAVSDWISDNSDSGRWTIVLAEEPADEYSNDESEESMEESSSETSEEQITNTIPKLSREELEEFFRDGSYTYTKTTEEKALSIFYSIDSLSDVAEMLFANISFLDQFKGLEFDLNAGPSKTFTIEEIFAENTAYLVYIDYSQGGRPNKTVLASKPLPEGYNLVDVHCLLYSLKFPCEMIDWDMFYAVLERGSALALQNESFNANGYIVSDDLMVVGTTFYMPSEKKFVVFNEDYSTRTLYYYFYTIDNYRLWWGIGPYDGQVPLSEDSDRSKYMHSDDWLK